MLVLSTAMGSLNVRKETSLVKKYKQTSNKKFCLVEINYYSCSVLNLNVMIFVFVSNSETKNMCYFNFGVQKCILKLEYTYNEEGGFDGFKLLNRLS